MAGSATCGPPKTPDERQAKGREIIDYRESTDSWVVLPEA
jgi:hypothetical protein